MIGYLDCKQSLFSSKICGKERKISKPDCGKECKTSKRDCERDVGAAVPLAASSMGAGRRVKRETALVSYNDLKAWHSGDGIILLVGLRRYDAHLSVTFLSDMQRTPKLCYNVCLLWCDSNGS